MHNGRGIEIRNPQRGDVFNEFIRPHVLADRGENRPSEQLHEQYHGCPDRDVLDVETGLRRNAGLLEAETGAEAEDDLVANPFGGGDVDRECRQKAGADGHEDDGSVDEGHVVADFRGKGAGDDRADDLGEDEGEVINAGVDGVDTLNGLEPDGQVVDEEEEGGADEEGEKGTEGDAALAGNSWRDCDSGLATVSQ